MPTEKNAAFLPTQYSFKLDRQRVKQNGSTDMPVKDSKGSNTPTYVIHTMPLYFSTCINSNIVIQLKIWTSAAQ